MKILAINFLLSLLALPVLAQAPINNKRTLSMATQFINQAALGKSVWYMGALFTILANGQQTGGRYALMEVKAVAGSEPPPHTHTRESEAYYVMEGELTFSVGGKIVEAKPGSYVYLPKGVQHGWKIKTSTAHVLIQVEPAGLENHFIDPRFSQVATELAPNPASSSQPTAEFMAQFLGSLWTDYGIDFGQAHH